MKGYNTSGADNASLRLLHGANSVEVAAGGVTIVGGVLTSPTITCAEASSAL